MGRWMDGRTHESPPVFYRTSSSLGPLPCFPLLQLTITQSRATGIAVHILPLGDLVILGLITAGLIAARLITAGS